MNLDSQEALLEHHQIIRSKGFLKCIYTDSYRLFKTAKIPKGPIVEIGSGGGFIKEIIPHAITSDVMKGPDIDKVFSATNMPFKNNSVAAFFMIDVLHHIKNAERALQEMLRSLKPGGKVIMIEPYNSLWGGIIYRYIHPERFDPKAGWKISGKGRMSDSNTALPWIIFVRDRKLFKKRFPAVTLIITPHTPLRYLVSGGLSNVQFLPTLFYPTVCSIETFLSPLNRYLGMFVTIELKKKS